MSETNLRQPRAHWLLLSVLLALVIALLAVNAFIHGVRGEGHQSSQRKPAATAHAGPTALLRGGPVVDALHPEVAGRRLPRGVIALTFDDGPSSYTGQILAILERHHVPATFFVIGSQVAAHPDTLRRIVRDGGEIGVHTFTHPDLGRTSGVRERLELQQTQQAIAAVTGYTTNLLRLPYSSTPSAITADEMTAIRRAGPYLVTFADLDTKDWQPDTTTESIVRAAVPAGGNGAIVMMHDGGGDRSKTVAALDELITRLQANGYRFETVTSAVGYAAPWQPASFGVRLRGTVTNVAVAMSNHLVTLLWAVFVLVGTLSVLRVIALLLCASRHARQPADVRYAMAFRYGLVPQEPVSVIVPAYNEELGIEAAVRSLLASAYDCFEIIVIDDGSTDDTAAVLAGIDDARLTILTQPNRGKAAALNAGIAAAHYDLLVLVDGDTVFEDTTIAALVTAFTDPEIGAVSGNTKVGNRGGLLGRWQHIEYVIGFNLDRRMFDVLRCMPTIPGAIGAFRREALESVGGISGDTLAEDSDVTMAICRAGWRVSYQPDAIAWTEAPASLGELWRQRYRWSYGTLQAMFKHRHAVLERGPAGKLGRRGLPYLLAFHVLLPMLAPVIDVAAVYGLLVHGYQSIVVFWLGFLALQFIAAAFAFHLDR
jgi:cellulose synthase/poly-beta-1,6-N-acetylglucosamine synthase-like glycosyltransferase/peptidoglycan/xylan/chitin deacetylase (PgdA/CDA1 family)